MLCSFYLRVSHIILYLINSHGSPESVRNRNFFRPFVKAHTRNMGAQKGGSFNGKQYRTRRRKQQGGFGGLFNLPAMIGSLFAPKKATPKRRPPPRRRRPPPNYQPSYRAPPPNYRVAQYRAAPRRRPPPLRRAPRQKGGFIADSVNYAFDDDNVITNAVKRKIIKKTKKQKGGSVLPANKIPWVKRVNLS